MDLLQSCTKQINLWLFRLTWCVCWFVHVVSCAKCEMCKLSLRQDWVLSIEWLLLNQFPTFPYVSDLSTLSKCWLPFECHIHIHIWQLLLQLSFGDTCQIWNMKIIKESNRYFGKMIFFRKLTDRILATPTLPWVLFDMLFKMKTDYIIQTTVGFRWIWEIYIVFKKNCSDLQCIFVLS